MKNKKVKSVNIISVSKNDNQFNDLEYYEYNKVENLDITPRKIVKIKAKIKKHS